MRTLNVEELKAAMVNVARQLLQDAPPAPGDLDVLAARYGAPPLLQPPHASSPGWRLRKLFGRR